MAGIIGMFAVLVLWRILVLFGTEVFQGVGLSPEAAGFEARSALAGAGYTTGESEYVVGHRVARRVAAILIVAGYVGPAAIFGLLGVGLVAPASQSVTTRLIALVVVIALFVLLDRTGIIRFFGRTPARYLATRMLAGGPSSTFDTWLVVGDRAIAAFVIPDGDRTRAVADAVTAGVVEGELTILGTDPPGGNAPSFPSPSEAPDPHPGDRVVVFGPQTTLHSIGDTLQA